MKTIRVKVGKLRQMIKEASNNKSEEREIIPFKQLKIGDIAYENPYSGGNWNNELGEIVWKGSYDELKKSKYKSLLSDWASELKSVPVAKRNTWFNFVVVDEPGHGYILFDYDGDPSSTVSFK